MKTINTYSSFNPRRYSNPWVAKVDKTGKIDFNEKVGGYTGRYGAGEAGELYIINPVEGQVYAFGQKDYRGNNGGYEYVIYKADQFVRIDKTELIKILSENNA